MKKNNLDEMQEQKLLKIERNGCWLASLGLFIAILVQSIMSGGNVDFKTIGAESSVFMVLAVYMCIACLRAGIWDRRLHPNGRTNFIVSAVTGAVVGIIWAVVKYIQYGSIAGSLAVAVWMFCSAAVLCFFALSLCAAMLKKRTEALEREADAAEQERDK